MIFLPKLIDTVPYGTEAYTKLWKLVSSLDLRQPIKIMDEDWDVLVILDACRYDFFQENNPFGQEARAVLSAGSSTPEWVKNNFNSSRDLSDIVYISANPFVSEQHLDRSIGGSPFKHIENVWDWGWDDSLKTVHPSIVTGAAYDAYKELDENDRLVVHYMQPHHPFVGSVRTDVEDPAGWRKAKKRVMGQREVNEEHIWDRFRRGEVSKPSMTAAYESNLELVLQWTQKLVNAVDGDIVVTSDHGNCFGEYGLVAHPSNVRVPELVKVPWLELKGKGHNEEIQGRVSGKPEPMTEKGPNVESRLKDLGYL